MKKFTKTFLSGILAAAMIFTSVPEAALVANAEEIGIPEYSEDAPTESSDGIDSLGVYEGAYFTLASSSDTTRALFTLDGDKATELTEDGSAEIKFDSTRDFVFYAVPAMGYDWADRDTAIGIGTTGKFTPEGGEEYTASTSDITIVDDTSITDALVSNSYGAYDWSKAKKVTIIGNSTLSTAMESFYAALTKDGGSTPNTECDKLFESGKYPYVEFATTAAVAQKISINIEHESGLTDSTADCSALKTVTYPASAAEYYNHNLAPAINAKDASKTIMASVSLVKGDDVIEFTADTDNAVTTNSPTDNGEPYTYNYTGTTMHISQAGLQYAYLMAKDGYKLTITLSEDAEAVAPAATTVTVTADGGKYVSFASADNKDTAKGTAIPAAGVSATKGGRFVFFVNDPNSEASTGRVIQEVDYLIAGEATPKEAKNDKEVLIYKDGSEVMVSGIDTTSNATGTSQTYDVAKADTDNWTTINAGGAVYYIPENDMTANIFISAITGEAVTVKNAYDGTAKVVTYKVNGGTDKVTNVASFTLTGAYAGRSSGGTHAATESEAITGEDYTFEILPASGKKVDMIRVDMFNEKGASPKSFTYSATASNNTLAAEDGGVYTVSSITGPLTITITTSNESGTLNYVSVDSYDSSKVQFYRTSDKKVIDDTQSVGFVEDGGSLTFKAVPQAGYAIKSMSYVENETTTDITSEGVADSTGAIQYTISNINSNINLKYEVETGYTFTKVANPYATVKVNDTEIKDGKTLAGVPAGTGITIEITENGGSFVKAWRYNNASNNITAEAGLAAVATLENGANKLTATTLNTITASNPVFLFVQTEREATGYSAEVTYRNAADEANVDVDLTKGVTLYAGGEDLATAVVEKHQVKLATTFKRDDLLSVTPSAAANTTYTLARNEADGTGKTAIAKFGTAGTESTYSVLTTTSLAHESDLTDTITVKESLNGAAGWVDQVYYQATIPLTVKPLKSFYEGGLGLISTVAATGSNTNIATGIDETVIRTYTDAKKTVFNDTATLNIMPYQLDEDGEKVARSNAIQSGEIGAKKEITEISWTTTPKYTGNAIVEDLVIDPVGSTTDPFDEKLVISEVKDAGKVTATATVTYVDGSEDTATIDLTAIAQTYGYSTLAVVEYNNEIVITNNTVNLDLERNNAKFGTAKVTYRVFEDLDGFTWSNIVNGMIAKDEVNTPKKLTEAGIAAYLSDPVGKTHVKEITDATFEDVEANNDGVSVKRSGSTYTITAAKVNTASVVKGDVSVNGVPAISTDVPSVTAAVYNKIVAYNITVNTGDSSGAHGGSGATAYDYRTPQLTTEGKAAFGTTFSNIGSDEANKATGYVFDGVTKGTVITLPGANAFTNVDPKRTLIGWKVNSKSDKYYPAGTKVTIASNDIITAVWEDIYGSITVYNDLKDAVVAATEYIALGSELPLSIRYLAIDADDPIDLNAGTVKREATYTTDAEGTLSLSLDAANPTSEALDLTTKAATVIGSKTTTSGVVVDYKWTIGAAEYSGAEINVGGSGSAKSAFIVENAKNFVLEMDETDETGNTEITILQGQSKQFPVYYYEKTEGTSTANNTKENAIDFNESGTYDPNVTVELADTGKDNVAVEASTSGHYVTVEALKKGSASVTITIVNKWNQTETITVKITVDENTQQKITLKKVNGTTTTTTDTDINVLVGSSAPNSNTVIFQYSDAGGPQEVGQSSWSIEDVTDSEETSKIISGSGNAPAITSVYAPDKTVLATIKTDNGFGAGTVKVTAAISATESFSAYFDLATYYQLTFKAQTGSEAEGNVYLVQNNGVTVADGAAGDIVEKIVYTGADTYTIANAANYKAIYPTGTVTNTDGYTNAAEKDFLGWGSGSADLSATTANVKFEAGKAIEIAASELGTTLGGASLDLYVKFSDPAITKIAGFDSVIRLTDETVGTNNAESTSTTTLTDYAVETITQEPKSSNDAIKIAADHVGFFTIYNGGTPERREGQTNVLWDSTHKTAAEITMTDGGTSKTGSFTVAKISGNVGATTLHLTTENLKYDIQLYVNGEYVSGGKTRYFEDGADLVSGSRSINGTVHYYRESELVTSKVIEEGGRLILINAAGKQVTAKGVQELAGKKYYVGKDGYVETGLFTGIDGKKYLAAKTGEYISYSMTDEGKITVDGQPYIIDKDTNEAQLDKKVYLDASVTPAWTWEFTGSAPTATVKVGYVDEDGTKSGDTLTADVDAGTVIFGDVTKFTATATPKFAPEGGEMTPIVNSKIYDITTRQEAMAYLKAAPTSKDWTWDEKLATITSIPEASVKVTIVVIDGTDTQEVTDTIKASSVEKISKDSETSARFKATATASYYASATATEATAYTWTDTYSYKVDKKTGDVVPGADSIDIAEEAGISIEDLEEEYAFTGAAITPAFSVVDNNRGVTLAKGVDYTVKFKNNKAAGTASVTVTGKGNYAGANGVATFKIVDPVADALKDSSVTLATMPVIKTVAVTAAGKTYTGEPVMPDSVTVTFSDKTTAEVKADDFDGNAYEGTVGEGESAKTFFVTISNNVNKGSATVTVTGANAKATKTAAKKKTFKIAAAPITSLEESDVSVTESAEYRVKGATPEIGLSFNGNDLVEGQDYTVKYKNNKAVGSATATISGKGNFSGKLGDKTFSVTALSLDDCTFEAATVFEGTKQASVKATILDPNGDALKVKTQYTLTVSPEEGGVDAKGKLVAGKTVEMAAAAAGNDVAAGSTIGNTFTVGANLGNAKVKVDNKTVFKEYTGEAIELTEEDWAKIPVTLKIGGAQKTLKYGEDFKVAGYTNNVKKGSMTITIVGTGDDATETGVAISGTKTLKVKIVAKSILK